MITVVILGGATVLLSVLWYSLQRGKTNQPPGPSGIPLLGNALQLDAARPYLTLTQWNKIYGDIFSISILGKKIHVVSGDDLIREVLITRTSEFAGRPSFYRVDYVNFFRESFSFSDFSAKFITQKKIVATSLKTYGNHLLKLEEISLAAIEEFLNVVQEKGDEAFDPKDGIRTCVASIVSSLIFSRRLSEEELEFLLYLDENGVRLVNPGGKGLELDIAPWLRYLPNNTFKELTQIRDKSKEFFETLIAKRKAVYDPETIECVLDSMLSTQSKDLDGNQQPIISDDNLFVMISDLIIAGTATTSISIYSFCALMVTHAHVQAKLQEEIDRIIGANQPRLAHRQHMPYMEAAILELLRYISHVPLLVPHKVVKDTTIGGYDVQTGDQIWVNVWSLHHDDRYWDAPWEYNPDRYLDHSGALYPPDHPTRKRTLPFGAGRRVCIGESLAKNRLFLFLASMIQKFNLKSPGEGSTLQPQSDPRTFDPSFPMRPQRFEIKMSLR